MNTTMMSESMREMYVDRTTYDVAVGRLVDRCDISESQAEAWIEGSADVSMETKAMVYSSLNLDDDATGEDVFLALGFTADEAEELAN